MDKIDYLTQLVEEQNAMIYDLQRMVAYIAQSQNETEDEE